MENYSRLTIESREEISRLVLSGLSFREIARKLGRNVSTISREVRNRLEYRAISGHKRARRNSSSRRFGKRKLSSNPLLLKVVKCKLDLFWSPEQIAQHLKSTYENPDMHVSAEAIYSYIYVLPCGELRNEFRKQLRQAHKKRRRRGVSSKGQGQSFGEMLCIEERPKEVELRTVPGHWEGDILIGGAREQTALGSLVERTTRTVILVPLKSKKAADVRKAFAKEIKKLPKQMRLTLTYDRGSEMAQHKLFTKDTKMQVYFAHPKSPWERGTNENTNGLIRQFFPKGTNFNKVSRKEIKRAQHLLNGRPRKTLHWRTPYEAMQELLR